MNLCIFKHVCLISSLLSIPFELSSCSLFVSLATLYLALRQLCGCFDLSCVPLVVAVTVFVLLFLVLGGLPEFLLLAFFCLIATSKRFVCLIVSFVLFYMTCFVFLTIVKDPLRLDTLLSAA